MVCALTLPVSAQAERLPRYGGDLRLEIFLPSSDASSPDPLQLWGDDGALVGSALYEGLVRWGAKQLEPGLAARWFRDEDSRRWLFKLRPEVRFHDGSRCDAQAVSESLHRLANPRASKDAWILRDLVGWKEFANGSTQQIEGISVLSPTEVELRLQRSVPDLPARLALPAAAITRRSDSGIVGTGAFQFVLATEDSLHTLAFDGCREGRPFLDSLDFVTGAPPTLALLRRTMSRADPLTTTPVGLVRVRSPARRLALCVFHPASASLADAATRERILSSFDASVFVRAGLGGDGEPAPGLWPDVSTLTALQRSDTDSMRRAAPRGAVRLLVGPGDPLLERLGERLQLRIASLGFDVTLAQLPAASFRHALRDGHFDLLLLGWTPLQGHAGDCSEETRVLHLLSHVLQPVMGSRLPPLWRDILEGRADADESTLRQDTFVAPLVFFHDLWQLPDTAHSLRPSAGSLRLGLPDIHLDPPLP